MKTKRQESLQQLPSPVVYAPTFDIPESISNGLGNKKIGQRIKAIVNYVVKEKTKSYVVLEVKGFFLTPSARRF